VRLSRRGAIQIYVYLYLYLISYLLVLLKTVPGATVTAAAKGTLSEETVQLFLRQIGMLTVSYNMSDNNLIG